MTDDGSTRRQGWLSPLVYLTNNTISYIGVFILTTAGVSWLFVLPVEAREGARHPYLGIFFFVLLPLVFFAGLTLVPLGIYLRYRREKKKHVYPTAFPRLDWGNVEFRRLSLFFTAATIANIIIGGYYTHATVAYMDSDTFCGTSCHSMTPEYTAFKNSPHVNIGCTDCHVGSGTGAYLKSKLNGASQLVSTVLDNFPRPIPTPIHNLRPAREICETCHWPEKFGGYRLRVWPGYAEDAENTLSETVLIMRVGGGPVKNGIHGVHVASGVRIEFLTADDRSDIPWVSYTDPSGRTVEYATEGWEERQASGLERRTMDCLDCHTRPSHRFLMPEQAMAVALSTGQIDRSLPWIMKRGLEVLTAGYSSTAEARDRIPKSLEASYIEEHPEVFGGRAADVRSAARVLVDIYGRNVFPEMNVDWGTYPDQIGHTFAPGCFRCHDEMHSSPEGLTITQDCDACHELLLVEETDRGVLERLGVMQ